MNAGADGGAPALTAVQRAEWARRRSGGRRSRTRALRLTGRIEESRLQGAVEQVLAAVDVLGAALPTGAGPAVGPRRGAVLANLPGPGGRPPAARDARCVEWLLDCSGVAPVTFSIVRVGADEVVLALDADALLLDLRSLYLSLGAVLQAYFDRFRPAEYPAFTALAAAGLLPDGDVPAKRAAWWDRRVAGWAAGPRLGGGPGPRRGGTLLLDDTRWDRLRAAAPHTGATGSIAVIALLTWWFRTRAGAPRAPVYASTLDLREYCDLGTVIGPLTDRIVFDVDESGLSGLAFADLVRRTHAGLLDAVVRYVPSERLLRPADPPGARPAWDVLVHYCRSPPSSSRTRGEASLAARGLSVELFAERELARADLGHDADATVEIDLTEDPGGVALLVDVDERVVPAAQLDRMLTDLDRLSAQAAADPDIPLARLTRR